MIYFDLECLSEHILVPIVLLQCFYLPASKSGTLAILPLLLENILLAGKQNGPTLIV